MPGREGEEKEEWLLTVYWQRPYAREEDKTVYRSVSSNHTPTHVIIQ